MIMLITNSNNIVFNEEDVDGDGGHYRDTLTKTDGKQHRHHQLTIY